MREIKLDNIITEDNEESDKKSLEDFLYDIDCLDSLDKYTNETNFFNVAGISNYEIRHSKFIAWLLNPSETHELNDYFLRKFLLKLIKSNQTMPLSVFEIDRLTLDNVFVYTEYNNIDILAISKKDNFILAIENKYHSKEHDNQLKKYKNFIQENYPSYNVFLAYLTIDGEPPKNDEEWGIISYYDIYEILEKCIESKKLKPKNEIIINDYIKLLQGELKMDIELQELCKEIYKKHKRAIDLIIENKPDEITDIRDSYNRILSKYEKENKIIRVKSTSGYLRFTTPKIRDTVKCIGYDTWLPTKDLFAFEIALYKADNEVHVWYLLGPGEQEIRDKYFNIMKTIPELKTRAKANNKNWTAFNWSCLFKYNEDVETFDIKSIEEKLIEYLDTIVPIVEKKMEEVQQQIDNK